MAGWLVGWLAGRSGDSPSSHLAVPPTGLPAHHARSLLLGLHATSEAKFPEDALRGGGVSALGVGCPLVPTLPDHHPIVHVDGDPGGPAGEPRVGQDRLLEVTEVPTEGGPFGIEPGADVPGEHLATGPQGGVTREVEGMEAEEEGMRVVSWEARRQDGQVA